jgi:hypothetical protein
VQASAAATNFEVFRIAAMFANVAQVSRLVFCPKNPARSALAGCQPQARLRGPPKTNAYVRPRGWAD